MRKIMIGMIGVITVLIMLVCNIAMAAVLVDNSDNTGYVYSEKAPEIKYLINNLDKFSSYITVAVIHRNDFNRLTLIGENMFKEDSYYYKYEILTGAGEVHIYMYRMLDDELGDTLFIKLSKEQIDDIMRNVKQKSSSKSKTVDKVSIQTVSNYSQLVANMKGKDYYSSIAIMSRLSKNNNIRYAMAAYHPCLTLEEAVNRDTNEYNATEVYRSLLQLSNLASVEF